MGIRYYEKYDENYYRKFREWYGYYLNKYLANNNLSLLYLSRDACITCVDVLGSQFERLNADTYSGLIGPMFEEHCRREYDFSFDYDLIIMMFSRCASASSIEKESDYIKQLASSISKRKNKRVSVGFFSWLNQGKYSFYSVNPVDDVIFDQGDMSDVTRIGVGYIGKVLSIHNRYVELDNLNAENHKSYVKSIDGLK